MRLARTAALTLSLCGLAAAMAQPASPQGSGTGPLNGISAPTSSPSFQQAIGTAEAFSKSNDLASAEQSLTALNITTPGTPEWHLETSQKLLQLAAVLAREGRNESTVSAVAKLTLQHLTTAASAARNVKDQAQANAASAIVYLRYLGDPVSAIAAYQAALRLTPSDPAIQQALTRLQDADAKLRARIHPPKS